MKNFSPPILSLLLLIIIGIINCDDVEPPETVELPLNSVGERFSVTLKRIDSYLANEHLPVWALSEHRPNSLRHLNQVMGSLGKFSMYQNPEKSSAAVFFHNRQQFSGVVDNRYVIHNLPYIQGDEKLYPTRDTLFRQPESPVRTIQRNILNRISRDIESYNETDKRVRTRRSDRHTVYLEILVMVDYSMAAQNILTPSSIDKYTPIVSHVLTLLNSVDMIFSKIISPQIKINIAGIIIADEPNSFKSVVNDNCLKTQTWSSGVSNEQLTIQTLGSTCAHESITSYLSRFVYSYKFRNSFNHVMFLTSSLLHGDDEASNLPPIMKGIYGAVNSVDELGPDHFWTIKLAIITGERYFGNYPATAHEFTHALSVNYHDDGPYIDDNDQCIAFIMRPNDQYCEKCLSWSPKSLKSIRTYFDSRARCVYRDDPKSLHSGPYEMFDADEQCRCYGYHSAAKQSLWKRITSSNMCGKYLKCRDEDKTIFSGPLPMDGTPCGTNKVCWARKCTQVKEPHTTQSCGPRF